MPTPSEEARSGEREARNEEWAARPAKSPRSVFANFLKTASAEPATLGPERGHSCPQQRSVANRHCELGASEYPGLAADRNVRAPATGSLQTAIDGAMARSFLYRFLAQAYEDPTPEGWNRLASPECRQGFKRSARALAASAPALTEAACAFQSQLKPEAFEAFLAAYLACFGHAARGRCPLNEIEYGDIKADPLFQPHRLADLAAFYQAFGLEVAADAGERQDHLCLELEFMCVLAAKEAYALEHQFDVEDLSLCRDAQRKFLREHLGRWTPAFARRLVRMAGGGALGALANLTRAFIEAECARHGITPGSEDLLLRPVDAAAESLCQSCGVPQAPPGALEPTQP
jgi:putative dimethyl sulfoxide reductase chaperone